MSAKASRDVLDWFRTYSVGKMDSIGRTDLTANMNLPIQNDTRVTSAITYLNGVYADALAAVESNGWHDYWASSQDEVWAEIEATMPAAVAADFDGLWLDTDVNVLILLKRLIVCTALVTVAYYGGGGT